MTDVRHNNSVACATLNGHTVGESVQGAKLEMHARWIAEFIADCGNYHRFKQQP